MTSEEKMKTRMMATDSTPVELSDGRIVRVSEYPDRSIRVKITGVAGRRYAVTECFLPGNGNEAILKLELL